jgi:hypothetical protein
MIAEAEWYLSPNNVVWGMESGRTGLASGGVDEVEVWCVMID